MKKSDLTLHYQTGFQGEYATEALPNTLPVGQNSPQKVAYGLYAEQFSGTAFTAPRSENRRSWFYRIRPGSMHGDFKNFENKNLASSPFDQALTPPTQLRWNKFAIPAEKTDFVEGLITVAGNGDLFAQTGIAIHQYVANQSMETRFFYCADGEFLIVPQEGRLRIHTEFGILEVEPKEIVVIPRGARFRVVLLDGTARGYVCENYGALFRLPELGPIGANGLANSRDFQTPVAAYEDREGAFELVAKFGGELWRADIDHSPLDVVAWHGNHAPYKYDLTRFNTINTVSFDHPDPSIFTVLTSPSGTFGTANVDFAIFPPRWMVAEGTFRPPWFHRNVMSEYMGLVYGAYDAKAEGFEPGGGSLHNCMSGHGPDATTFENASRADLKPHKIENTMAFMFESRYVIRPTKFALECKELQKSYVEVWHGLKKNFEP